MADFTIAFDYLLKNEGGFVNNSSDPGGATKYGISFFFLRSQGNKYDFKNNGITVESIRSLTLDQAKEIYKDEFWDQLPYEEMSFQPIANYIFDTHVNIGQGSTVRIIQRALHAIGFTRTAIVEDGKMGNKTKNALISEMSETQSAYQFKIVLKAIRAEYYYALVRLNPGNKKFIEGWLNRCYESI